MNTAIYPADKVAIREVGLRDGLQLVKQWPPTQAKADWVTIDYEAGIRHFEAGSFLPASSAPQFADVEQVLDVVASLPKAFSSALILNPKGAERALRAPVDELIAVVSASEQHNLANIRRSRAQSLDEFRELVSMRNASDRRPLISVGIAMSFGCSIEGDIPIGEVLRIAEACAEAGADVIYIADTVGYGGPRQVTTLVRELRSLLGDLPIGAHFHDTRGLGLANAAAALDHGVRILDASLAGLGGCPFAPKATGNIVLEDAIFLAQTMGFDVPVDLDVLVEARAILAQTMPDEKLYGGVAAAGGPRGSLIA
jgi:hydroxymethylglutaryl-CoA lyase